MRPLRIIHVSPFFEQAWAYGGIPRVVAALAHAQVQRGHHVTVVTTDVAEPNARLSAPAARFFGAWEPQRSADGIELRVFPNLSNAVAYHLQFFLPFGLSQYLRRHAGDFDVAHVHGCHNLPGAIASAHLHRAGVPYVLAPHGTAPRIERRVLAKWVFDHTLGRRVLPDAARLLAVTEAERAQLIALGVPPRKIRVIPHPINLEETKDVSGGRFRRRFGVRWKEIVLYLGKLTPRKGIESLVEAFSSLRRPDAGLVIAGNDMGSGASVRKLVRSRGMRDRTLLTGLLRGSERLEALADASVVAYPSQHEIFGLVPIEALLCGTPVVVSNDSGCGEVVGSTGGGKTVRYGDTSALATAIESVLDEPERWRRAAHDAREHVISRYRTDVVLARLDRLYEEMRGDAPLRRVRFG